LNNTKINKPSPLKARGLLRKEGRLNGG